MTSRPAALAPILALAAATPAMAQHMPEQLEQLEPGAGKWQAEYAFGKGEGPGHALQLMRGIGDRLALGVEIEFTRERRATAFDSAGLAVLWRGAEAGEGRIGWGVKAQAGLGRDGGIGEAEVRLIGDARPRGWRLQGDAMLRRVREDGASATGLAYALSAQRAVGGLSLGVEASGKLARTGGAAALFPAGSHYAGPSATLEIAGRIEVSAALLARVAGGGPRTAPRLTIQIVF